MQSMIEWADLPPAQQQCLATAVACHGLGYIRPGFFAGRALVGANQDYDGRVHPSADARPLMVMGLLNYSIDLNLLVPSADAIILINYGRVARPVSA